MARRKRKKRRCRTPCECGWRALARARPEARQLLERLPQAVRVKPGDAERGDAEGESRFSGAVDYGALHYIVSRLLERAEVKSRGADAVIEFKAGVRVWLRKRILEEAGLLGGGRNGGG